MSDEKLQTTKKALENIVSEFKKLQDKYAEAEANKSPEQRALERKQSELRSKAIAEEKTKKEQLRCDQLFKNWLKRDVWLVYDEAMPLAKAEVPDDETFLNMRDAELWKLVQGCANESLKIVNPDAKPKLWKVKPFEWVRWLQEKEQPLHPQLKEYFIPKALIQPTSKTLRATKTRERKKAERISAIKSFCLKAGEMARKYNVDWNDQEVPITKADFLEVFSKLNTAFKKISPTSFDRDIAEIGIKFKKGTKHNKNNVLKKLFFPS